MEDTVNIPNIQSITVSRLRSFVSRHRWLFIIVLGVILAKPGIAFAEYCWIYVETLTAKNPTPWECDYTPPSGSPSSDPSAQNIIDEHANWHCVNGHLGEAPGLGTGPGPFDLTYGQRFLGIHKQMINDFDQWRDDYTTLNRIETWDPNPWAATDPRYNPMPWGIPGSGVSAADAGAIAGGTCLDGTGRSGNGVDPATYTRCPGCNVLFARFRVPPVGTLDTFSSADELGIQLDFGSGWHGTFHAGVANAVDSGGNSCADINPPATSPRDAMFWRAHDALDEVHAAWLRLQPTDVVIALDRSGSMSQPSEADSSVTKMDAAKSAAALFADLIEDEQGHTTGVVSYSSTASVPPDLGLTAADSTLMTTVQSAMGGISASGATSIGDGLIKAQDELISNGTNSRKAILLLTDGKENTPPCLDGTGSGCIGPVNDIASDAFGDTHICAIGFGVDDSTLDSIILRDLSERQGGIYTSGGGSLNLAKFFVDCFADIFDESITIDPIENLGPEQDASDPIRIPVNFATKVTFVLAWEQVADPLQLSITTPSGEIVDLTNEAIESSFGPTWHIVRIPLPYKSEGSGDWEARAVRQHPPKATSLVVLQAASYTPEGLTVVALGPDESVVDQITIPGDSSVHKIELIGEEIAAVVVTGGGFESVIVEACVGSEKEAPEPLRCVDFQTFEDGEVPGRSFELDGFSFNALGGDEPFVNDIATGVHGLQFDPMGIRIDLPAIGFQRYFIDILTSGAGRLQPTNLRFQHYTGEPLFPVARVTAPYRPMDEFDQVEAKVTVIRPLVGSGNLLAEFGLGQEAEIAGDIIDPRSARLKQIQEEADTPLIPTITETFSLNDEGMNGDRYANNNYWSTQLMDLATVEGVYHFHFEFVFMEGGETIQQETSHSIYVEVKIDPDATRADVLPLDPGADGRNRTQFVFTPMDKLGNLLGPGRADLFELSVNGDARIESEVEDDGRGTYSVVVSWTEEGPIPTLILSQNGTPRQTVDLPTGEIERGLPDIHTHFPSSGIQDPLDFPQLTVKRDASNRTPVPGEEVTMTIVPENFSAFFYAVEEDIGELVYTGSHTAQGNPEGTTFAMTNPVKFTYTVKVPVTAKPGERFVINGEAWDNFQGINRVVIEETELVVPRQAEPGVGCSPSIAAIGRPLALGDLLGMALPLLATVAFARVTSWRSKKRP